MCEEWGKKPKEEQSFEAFHRAISAAAAHQGGKLKYKVNMLMGVSTLNHLTREGKGPFTTQYSTIIKETSCRGVNCAVDSPFPSSKPLTFERRVREKPFL